jgi:hypothetical protein
MLKSLYDRLKEEVFFQEDRLELLLEVTILYVCTVSQLHVKYTNYCETHILQVLLCVKYWALHMKKKIQ